MRYRIEVNKADRPVDGPYAIEFANTLAEAGRVRTLMAKGTGLPRLAINIVRIG